MNAEERVNTDLQIRREGIDLLAGEVQALNTTDDGVCKQEQSSRKGQQSQNGIYFESIIITK